ncbi:acyltransferase [Paenibacillus sp. P46E]|uniref:acyltransferase family protein n=1 Tax=Paenibacillus sp. P46E TaxID=1349436 RepID=UPI00093A7021|nr:acyltransferase [Paenibacillus sp. P46E]OKP95380.1 hypothetical protein A3849_26205 [Paenibacillus sp. P46E]
MYKRYEELDSLRGIAALTVLFGHILLVFKENFWTSALFKFGPLKGLVAGGEAVILFFVLSGFVLSIPFYSGKKLNYATYALKRICRIYLPYIVVIFFAFILRELLYSGNISGISNWINALWSEDISKTDLVNYSLLIGHYSGNLNFVVWSLVHEMRISLIFPLLMILLMKANYKQIITGAIFISLLTVLYVFVTSSSFSQTEWFSTVNYASLFIIGALIAKHREEIINYAKGMRGRNRILLLGVGLVLFIYGHPSFAVRVVFSDFDTFSFYGAVLDTWTIAIGAVIMVVLSISSVRLSKILRNDLISYLGKISYSLYLTHLIVLASLIHLLNGYLPIWAISAMAIIGSFIVASAVYKFVENPSKRLGERLANKAGRRPLRKLDDAA